MSKTAWLACGLIVESKIEIFKGQPSRVDLRWNDDVAGLMPVFKTKKAATKFAKNNKLGELQIMKVHL